MFLIKDLPVVSEICVLHLQNDLIKPAIQGTLNILRSCLKAKTVKLVVHTSSACTVSVNQQKGIGYVLDEEAWSDIDYMLKEKPPTWVKLKHQINLFTFSHEFTAPGVTVEWLNL